jgi:hypothetical protein
MRSGLKVIEERTDNKLAGEPPTAIFPSCEACAPHHENLTVCIMSKLSTPVNAFLRIMRILLRIIGITANHAACPNSMEYKFE